MVRRILQVGLGRWGRDWATHVVPAVPLVESVGGVDASAPARVEVQQAGIMAAADCYESLGAALEATDADAVLVTTNLTAHVPVVREALEAGKDVLVEKPFAPSMLEARELVDVAEKLGRTLMVSQNYRFFPAVRAVQQIVRDRTLGELWHVDIDFRRYSPPPPGSPPELRGWPQPLLVDMSIHHFDLLRAVIGADPTSVYCRTWNPTWAVYRDPPEGSAIISFGDTITVDYRGSWIHPAGNTPWAGEWRMEFEGGEVWWTSRGDQHTESEDAVWLYEHGAERRSLPLPDLPFTDRAGSLAAFARAVEAGIVPESSAAENLESLALTYGAVESAERHGPVVLGETH